MRRFDTLFVRLLLAQLVTAVVLLSGFGFFFYTERSRTVARLVAERWAPALRAAAGEPVDAGAAVPLLQSASELPARAVHSPALAPRIAELRADLLAQGVPVQGVALSRGADNPVVWIALPAAGGSQRWFGLTDELIEPRLPQRMLVAQLLALAVVAGISWVVARHLTRPLDRLRQRLLTHAPGSDIAAPAEPAAAAPTAEIAAIEAAFSALRERLARHERERRLMLAGVSHDLRSPLARIRMAAELLPDDPALQARRDGIVRNVDVVDRLVQSFVDHLRAAELPLDETVDLAALARAAAAGLLRPAGELQLDLPPALPLPHANRLLLERVLHNLLDNAFKHGRPPVRLTLAATAGEAFIAVQDAGAGIAPEQQAHLLQAFARGEASRGVPGTGLGLAIVAEVVARLGGRIDCDTAPGAAVVRVRLPLRASA